MTANFSGMDLRLDGNRLYLRTLTETDASPRYAGWLNDPDVNRFLETKSATVESVRAYINEKRARPDALFFGIFLRDGDEWIGTIKLEPIDLGAKQATIAIMIGEKGSWGRGYGPEAMHVLIAFAFKTLGVAEVRLGVLSDNAAALKAYESVGFREISRTGQSVRYGDKVYDHVWMAVTPEALEEADRRRQARPTHT